VVYVVCVCVCGVCGVCVGVCGLCVWVWVCVCGVCVCVYVCVCVQGVEISVVMKGCRVHGTTKSNGKRGQPQT